MSNDKHTHEPTPWILGGCSGRMITTESGYVGDGFIADVDTQANAAFIVRACNSHAALVSALEDLVWLRKREDESFNDVFERIGERFYQEHGILRPGKSEPLEIGGSGLNQEDRQEVFDAWIDGFCQRARAALEEAKR